MKRIYALLLLGVVFMASADVRWLTMVNDFGAFHEDDGPVDCKFQFINDGNSPISIVSVRTSCGCTTTGYDRHSVAPGDTGSISVTYDPAGHPGRFNKSITVEFSKAATKAKLSVVGVVVGSAATIAGRFPIACADKMRFEKDVVMFGEMTQPSLRTVFIQGYNISTSPIKPVIEGLPKYIDVKIVPEIVPPGEQFSLVCYIRTDKSPLLGLVSDTFTIRTEDSAEACTFSTTANIKEDFSKLSDKELRKAPIAFVAEPTADFGRLSRNGECQSRSVTIHNAGKSTLSIRRAYTTDAGITISVDKESIKAEKDGILTISVDPTALTGAMLNARITLITNDPSNPIQIIRAVGELID